MADSTIYKKVIGDGFFLQVDSRFIWDKIKTPDGNDQTTLGDKTNIRAISFYKDGLEDKIKVIDHILPETKLLFVNISEPSIKSEILSLEKYYQDDDRVIFFSDIVPNFPSKKFKTILSWFIVPINIYTTDLGKRLLDQINFSPARKPMMFDCLLGGFRSHREIVDSHYKKSSYQDKIIFSYFKERSTVDWDDKTYWDDYSFLHDLITPAENTNGEFFHYQWKNSYLYLAKDRFLPITAYNQSCYSIVVETSDYNEFNQYTEKVAKPLVSKRPFVAFSGQNYLKNLRQLGFQTFSSVIDESYDAIEDRNLRYKMAWEQVEYLCQQDPIDVYKKLDAVLEHNQRHFLEIDWHAEISRSIPTDPKFYED